MRDLHHAANLHLLKNRFLTRIGPLWNDDSWRQKWWSSWVRQIQKTVCQIVKTCPFIGTLGRRHSTRTCFLVVKREFWFYRAAMCSHEGRSCPVRDFFEFTWHSFTWIKIILWQIIVIMKVDGQYHFIFLIWSVAYYSILSLSTLQPTMRCFRIPCIPFLFWPAWLCRNLCLLIS